MGENLGVLSPTWLGVWASVVASVSQFTSVKWGITVVPTHRGVLTMNSLGVCGAHRAALGLLE